MQKLCLIRYNNQIHRILAFADHRTLLINCEKGTMPQWVQSDLITNCACCAEEDLLATNIHTDFDSLSAEKKKLAHKRYTMIAPALAFLTDDYMRARSIEQAAQQYGITPQTIRKYLCLFLVYQRIEALVQSETKTDRPLSNDEKNFRWAINKFFYSPAKHTPKGAYLLMLKEKYTDASGSLMDNYPAFHRFRYFYTKTKKMQNYYISREGLAYYKRNHRALLGGGVRDFAPHIGIGLRECVFVNHIFIKKSIC